MFCQSRLQVFFAALQYQVIVILVSLLSFAECSRQSGLFVLLVSNFSALGDRPAVDPLRVICVLGLPARRTQPWVARVYKKLFPSLSLVWEVCQTCKGVVSLWLVTNRYRPGPWILKIPLALELPADEVAVSAVCIRDCILVRSQVKA
jgi:hypothetical protein